MQRCLHASTLLLTEKFSVGVPELVRAGRLHIGRLGRPVGAHKHLVRRILLAAVGVDLLQSADRL